MNLTEQEAILIGEKVVLEININYDKDVKPKATFDQGKNIIPGVNTWTITYMYGKEDFGKNVGLHISILDVEKKAIDIHFRNGSIDLGYDKEKDKYFIKEKKP